MQTRTPRLSPEAANACWLFEHSTDLLGVLSPDHRILALNPVWPSVTGWAAEELIGRPLLDFVHPDERAGLAEVLAPVREDIAGSSAFHFARKDGGWIWLEGNARVGADGELISVWRDATELVELRNSAMAHENYSWPLIQNAPFAVALFDRELRYAMVSPRWIEMFGLTARSFLGKRLDELAPGRYDVFIEAQKRALAGESIHQDFEQFTDSLGKIHALRWDIRPWRDGDGEIAGAAFYVDDIDPMVRARREAEALAQRLNIALDAASGAVFEVDFENRSVWISPQFMELVGRSITFEEATGAVWPFIHPDHVQEITNSVISWLSGAEIKPMVARIVRTDGAERWVRFCSDFEKDEKGVWRRQVILLLDIDESKRQELALIEAEEAALVAAEAKAQFIANMSHEIRTPMNGVMGVLHLLKQEQLSQDGKMLLGEALDCGRMLQALLDDVVDFSKIEAGRLDLAREPMDPGALLSSVVGLLRPQAEAKGLSVTVQAPDLPASVLGDSVRLRQCLFNLLGNAVKFTERGSVVVRASAPQQGDDRRLRFEIEDTGIGISQASQAKLFQRFQQADGSSTRRFSGSGLGLAITRKLATMMGGEVGVVSAPGQGSTFWLEIQAPDAPAPALDVDDAPQALLDGLRILVVEDNATNRLIATRLLAGFGAEVQTADDGERGVAAVAQGDFDLVLMDIHMPVMDGLTATRAIRALGGPAAQTPIIALTADMLSHHRERYAAAGMNGVVGKPISPAQLLAEINRLATAGEGEDADQAA
ncbi:MAG: PAS domain S-box protein [Caulobacterales bacterium]